MALYPNLLMFLTGATKLWVSFAEGFFAISGFFIGFLYRKKIRESFGLVAKKLLKRSFYLYLWSIFLTILFTYWGNMLPRGSVKESLWILKPDNLLEFFVKTLTFQYNYGWADILPVYTVLIFLSIGGLWLVSKRKGALLMLISCLFWYLWRAKSIAFAVLPLYSGGLLIGYNYAKIKYYFTRLGKDRTFKLRTILYGSFLLTLAINLYMTFGFSKFVSQFSNADFWLGKQRILNWYFDKQTVGLARLLLSPVWILTGYFIFLHYRPFIKKHLGWFLGVFGKNSLYAYIIHAFVIYPVPFFMSTLSVRGSLVNTVVSIAMVTWVFLFTRLTSESFKGKFDR